MGGSGRSCGRGISQKSRESPYLCLSLSLPLSPEPVGKQHRREDALLSRIIGVRIIICTF